MLLCLVNKQDLGQVLSLVTVKEGIWNEVTFSIRVPTKKIKENTDFIIYHSCVFNTVCYYCTGK